MLHNSTGFNKLGIEVLNSCQDISTCTETDLSQHIYAFMVARFLHIISCQVAKKQTKNEAEPAASNSYMLNIIKLGPSTFRQNWESQYVSAFSAEIQDSRLQALSDWAKRLVPALLRLNAGLWLPSTALFLALARLEVADIHRKQELLAKAVGTSGIWWWDVPWCSYKVVPPQL